MQGINYQGSTFHVAFNELFEKTACDFVFAIETSSRCDFNNYFWRGL